MYKGNAKTLVAILLSLVFILDAQAEEEKPPKIKAIAFDAFPIFDPRPVVRAAEEAFPGQGQDLMKLWRSRIFEYQ